MKQTVRAFLRNNTWEYLMVKHVWKDYWSLPGWKIENWETLYKAMKREIKEELNLEIKILWNKIGLNIENIKERPLPICNYTIKFQTENFWKVKRTEYIFLCEIKSGEIVKQDEEIEEYKFFSKEELLKFDWTFIQVKEILKNIV